MASELCESAMIIDKLNEEFDEVVKEKDELLQIFPIPALITKYENTFEEEFKCDIPDEAAEKIITVKDAIDLIKTKTS